MLKMYPESGQVTIFNADIRMELGLKKCGVIDLKRRKTHQCCTKYGIDKSSDSDKSRICGQNGETIWDIIIRLSSN